MAVVTLKGTKINTVGQLPTVGSIAPDFLLVKNDLSTVSLTDFKDNNIILNIFPSIDTGTCAASVRKFNQEAANLPNTKVLCISKDLPFAQSRFCGAEGIENVITLSDYRDGNFGKNYGLVFVDGPLQELHARAVIVINKSGTVIYTEQVPEIVDEPDYKQALQALKNV